MFLTLTKLIEFWVLSEASSDKEEGFSSEAKNLSDYINRASPSRPCVSVNKPYFLFGISELFAPHF